MKLCFIDQMSKVREVNFNISARKAIYGISTSKIKCLNL